MVAEREATLTYINAAPQYPGFNKGYWKEMEEIVKDSMTEHCGKKDAYFVTGVAPGKNNHQFMDGKQGSIKNKVFGLFVSKAVDVQQKLGED